MNIPKHIQSMYKESEQLFSLIEIEDALDKMAFAITNYLSDTNPIVVCVLKGGMITMSNLLLRFDFPLEIDYLHATRYQGEISGGELEWRVAPSVDFSDRTVLIVDDILDGGVTLGAIVNFYRQKGVGSVYTAVLVEKQHPRKTGAISKADFTGITIEDHFIFGYGMDYQEYLRNAPGIFRVKESK